MRAPLKDLVCSACDKPVIIREFIFHMFEPRGSSPSQTDKIMHGIDTATKPLAYDPARADDVIRAGGMDQRSIWKRMRRAGGGVAQQIGKRVLSPGTYAKVEPFAKTADWMSAAAPGGLLKHAWKFGSEKLRSGLSNFGAFLNDPLYKQYTAKGREARIVYRQAASPGISARTSRFMRRF